MNNTLVAVHIVSWNSLQHLPGCLDSIVHQQHQPIELLVIDNASVDGTESWLREHYPHIHLLRNTRNLGFARAHNQGLRITESPYVLMLNPDVILEPEWLTHGVRYLESHPEAGSFGGKLRRFEYSPDELREVRFSDIIDSTGLQGNRARHFVDRGSGTKDTGQYDHDQFVFGFSGACVLFRRRALESVRYKDEYIDEDFFAYKDDTDLAWRLQRQGWTAWYDHRALGYHHRTVQGQSLITDRLIARNHRSHSAVNSYYSYRNHWLMLIKHERAATLWRDGPWIGWYELKKFIFLLIRRPIVLRAWRDVWRLQKRMNMKAAFLDHQSKRSAMDIRKWFLKTAA